MSFIALQQIWVSYKISAPLSYYVLCSPENTKITANIDKNLRENFFFRHKQILRDTQTPRTSHIQTKIHTHIHIETHTLTHTYYIHTHSHIYTHTQTHTHTHTKKESVSEQVVSGRRSRELVTTIHLTIWRKIINTGLHRGFVKKGDTKTKQFFRSPLLLEYSYLVHIICLHTENHYKSQRQRKGKPDEILILFCQQIDIIF